MAPRRVADNLIEAEDARDPVREREDQLLAGEQEDEQVEDDQQDEQIEGDEPDDQSDESQDDDQREVPAQRRRVRESSQIEERLTAAERRAEDAERRAVEAQARYEAMQQVRQQAPAESAEQEAARLALMTPEQIIDYKVDKALRSHNQTVAQATFGATNAADKASFDTLVNTNPAWRKIASDVERKHTDMVREAQTRGAPAHTIPSRQTVLTYMLGERAMKMAENTGKEQQARQRRVQQQQTRPGSARSDVAPARRGGQTLEQRLEKMAL